MGILATVLADAGWIALDIAGIERGLVERRRKQQRHLVLRPDQFALNRRHGPLCARRLASPGDHRPGLGNRINAALVIRGGTQRRAVVEPGTAVPIAIPGLALQCGLQRVGMRTPCRRAGGVAARIGQRRECAQRCVQQPAEPDALALPQLADPVHAVVPITCAHQRQSAIANFEAGIESARAMLEQGADLVGHRWQEEAVMLCGPQKLAFQERHHSVEHGGIAVGIDIMRDGVGEPCPIIGDARAHTLAGMRQPPMLHVAFDELSRRGPQQMLACQRRPSRRQRHPVLQLVAEAIGTARLIERRARPDAADQRLIQQPAVQHDVHRPIGRLHLHSAEDILPAPADFGQHGIEILRAVARDQPPRLLCAGRFAEKEHDLDPRVRRQHKRGSQRGAGIEAGANGVGERRRAGKRCRIFQRAIAADELPPIGGPVHPAAAQIGEGDARSEGGIPWVAREHRAGFGIDLGGYERCGGGARRTQHPLHIGGHRQMPRAP